MEKLKEVEDFLRTEHAKDYHGTDDAMVDAFEDWIGNLESDDWIELMAKYATRHSQQSEGERLIPLGEEELGFSVFRFLMPAYSDNECRERWTAKHWQALEKKQSAELAKSICSTFTAPAIKLPGKKEISELSTLFCHRVGEWCNRTGDKYPGDGVIAPVFENVVKDFLDQVKALNGGKE
jgi:hypothetical protein